MALQGPFTDDRGREFYLDDKGVAHYPQELKGLHVREISLVDRPANRRKFLLWKSEGGESDVPTEQLTDEQALQLEEWLNTYALGEDAIVTKSLSAEGKTALRAVARLVLANEDSLPPRLVKLIRELSGQEVEYGSAKVSKSEEMSDQEVIAEVERTSAEHGSKALDVIDPAVYGRYRQLVLKGAGRPAVVEKAAPWRGGPVCVEIAKRAEQLIRKSSKPLDTGEAMLQVLEADSDLALAYRKEVLGMTA